MRSELLHVGEWNRETLWELLITMPLFDQKEIAALMTSIINQETWHNSTIEILASVLIAYTKRLYKERNFSEARKIINVIKQMPTDPTLMLHKVLATCYSDLIDQNSRAEKIAKLLKMMNYQRFLEID